MRNQIRYLIPALLVLPLAALTRSQPVVAQARGTTQRELPNVMLLVDTSGSMERMAMQPLPGRIDAPLPGEYEAYRAANPTFPRTGSPYFETPVPASPTTCVPGVTSTPNRWGSLVQALTGSFQPGFSCAPISRLTTGPTFSTLYGAGASDINYLLPYHRPLTGPAASPCGVMPERVTSPALGVESLLHDVAQPAGTRGTGLPCTFAQADDGQLDVASDLVRFGLMTFDGVTSPATNASGGYSYFLGTGSATANPAGCTDPPRPFEVGARTDFQDAARTVRVPQWEGPLVRFPDPDATVSQVKSQNDSIQRALAALRPSGATPIDGMMKDVRDYLWSDNYGPNGSAVGHADSFVKAGCREQYVILLTDGAPNLDMRPECEGGGLCPYGQRAKQVASDMYLASGNKKVTTFVIGFAVSGARPGSFPSPATTCGTWYSNVTASLPPASKASAFAAACNALPAAQLEYGTPTAACCTLNEISVNGNGGPASFADNQTELAEAFAKILALVASDVSTRSTPAYAAPTGVDTRTASFAASFEPNPIKPWSGNIARERLVCIGGTRTPVAVDASVGDNFAAALTSQNASNSRNVLMVSPPPKLAATVAEGRQSLRPYEDASPPDFTAETASEVLVQTPLTDIIGANNSRGFGLALGIDATTCPKSIDASNITIPALTGDDCRKSILGFSLASGPSAMAISGYDFSKVRCPSGHPTCNALGAVYRANPLFVAPPSATLRDETYRAFARKFPLGFGQRPSVLYLATTDGQLHAFDALNEDPINTTPRELWTFIPPGVARELKTNLPRGSRQVLDGTPVARDVVFDRSSAAVSSTQISSGPLDVRKDGWHTVLAAAMGTTSRGYYSLDITDPSLRDPLGTLRTYTAGIGNAGTRNPGPHFLWQLTDLPKLVGESNELDVHTDVLGAQRVSMLGRSGATPAITTLFFDPAGGTAAREIAVAILPGGMETQAIPGASCPRQAPLLNMATGYAARNDVRKWTATAAQPCTAGVIGRSLTIVRLDNGQIIRAFGRNSATSGFDLPKSLRDKGLVNDTPLDSPMVGAPIVFPSGAGAITQKAFVSDADGTVWRFDLTSRDPAAWSGRLFLDTQNRTVNLASAAIAAQSGEPIGVAPVVSAAATGDVMLGIATGDQEQLPRTGPSQVVYSVTEQYGASVTATAVVNWYQVLANAERVTGPMAIFDGIFYYATYRPSSTAAVCANGKAYVYGVDYLIGANPQVNSGGEPRTFFNAALYAPYTVVSSGKLEVGDTPVPGVSIRSLAACVNDTFEAYATNTQSGSTVATPGEFGLVFGTAKRDPVSGVASTKLAKIPLPPLRKATRIDSWASVME
jgi:type IV pilus assembly protein PilY1